MRLNGVAPSESSTMDLRSSLSPAERYVFFVSNFWSVFVPSLSWQMIQFFFFPNEKTTRNRQCVFSRRTGVDAIDPLASVLVLAAAGPTPLVCTKRTYLLELSPCLSRACLGKMMI